MLSVLPDYVDTSYISDPASNLAAAALLERPYPTPGAQLYRAYDGTPIGYSHGCDPISAEPMLSGLPEMLEGYRIKSPWDDWVLPVILAMMAFQEGASMLTTGVWSFAGYMAPVPTAVAWVAVQPRGERRRYAAAALGQAWDRYKHAGEGFVVAARPGPWQEQRRCVRFKRLSTGRRVCAEYRYVLPEAAYRGRTAKLYRQKRGR